eukprot:IDg7085t1
MPESRKSGGNTRSQAQAPKRALSKPLRAATLSPNCRRRTYSETNVLRREEQDHYYFTMGGDLITNLAANMAPSTKTVQTEDHAFEIEAEALAIAHRNNEKWVPPISIGTFP